MQDIRGTLFSPAQPPELLCETESLVASTNPAGAPARQPLPAP